MVKLQVSSGESNFEELPAMPDTLLYLQQVEFLEAETDQNGNQWPDRLKFYFEILEVEDEEHDEHVGKVFHAFGNMPQGKSGKLATNSNLYEILEGLSGGDFDPGDEIDTDDYEGKWGDDPSGAKKTKLRHLRPVRKRRGSRREEAPAPKQSGYDWDGEEEE